MPLEDHLRKTNGNIIVHPTNRSHTATHLASNYPSRASSSRPIQHPSSFSFPHPRNLASSPVSFALKFVAHESPAHPLDLSHGFSASPQELILAIPRRQIASHHTKFDRLGI